MNAKHAGNIETRNPAEIRLSLMAGPKKVPINSCVRHIGKHGICYARGRNG